MVAAANAFPPGTSPAFITLYYSKRTGPPIIAMLPDSRTRGPPRSPCRPSCSG